MIEESDLKELYDGTIGAGIQELLAPLGLPRPVVTGIHGYVSGILSMYTLAFLRRVVDGRFERLVDAASSMDAAEAFHGVRRRIDDSLRGRPEGEGEPPCAEPPSPSDAASKAGPEEPSQEAAETAETHEEAEVPEVHEEAETAEEAEAGEPAVQEESAEGRREYTVEDIARIGNIARQTVYERIKDGRRRYRFRKKVSGVNHNMCVYLLTDEELAYLSRPVSNFALMPKDRSQAASDDAPFVLKPVREDVDGRKAYYATDVARVSGTYRATIVQRAKALGFKVATEDSGGLMRTVVYLSSEELAAVRKKISDVAKEKPSEAPAESVKADEAASGKKKRMEWRSSACPHDERADNQDDSAECARKRGWLLAHKGKAVSIDGSVYLVLSVTDLTVELGNASGEMVKVMLIDSISGSCMKEA